LPSISLECDVVAGLEDVAADEIRRRLRSQARLGWTPGKLRLELSPAELPVTLGLRTVAGAWVVVAAEGRHPAALSHGRRLVDAIEAVLPLHPTGSVRAFVLNAPGLKSPAMRSLVRDISASTGLRENTRGLLIRLRRRDDRWEALIAVSLRPLAERPWRVSRTAGLLNGPLAASLVSLTTPGAEDRFLNVASGSGTIAIERALAGPARTIVAADISDEAASSARANSTAAAVSDVIRCLVADGSRLPFAGRSFDVVCADLPWGFQVGSHERNVNDYERLLAEIGRVTVRRTRMVLLTSEIRLMQTVLGGLTGLWRLDKLVRVEQGGARPGVYVLRRS
jgi:tRNA (guanine6-N2)-methyltransferase